MNRRQFLLAGAGGLLALRAGALPGAARAGGTPVALVTADAEAHVAVVDPASGRVLRRLPTAPAPRSIEAAGPWALVAHSELGRVTLIDAASLARREIRAGLGEPRYTAAHPDGRYAYLTDSGLGQVLVIDLARGRIARRVAVGGPARHIGIDARARRLWTALGSTASRLALLDLRDPSRPRLLGHLRPPFLAHDVAFAPDGRAWVTSGDRGRIAVYDPARGRLLRTLPADAPPQHLAFAAGWAYVTSGDDGTLRAHDLDGRLLRTTSVPVGSFNVCHDLSHLVTPSLSRGTLCLLDRGGRRRRTVQVARAAHDACLVMTR